MFNDRHGYDVFLGGTTNKSSWRETFIEEMKRVNPKISCFNPVVDNWNDESVKLENFIKHHARFHLYVLTPNMRGVYSIAEMVESAMGDKGKTTVFCILETDIADCGATREWDPIMRNSLSATSNLLLSHGALKATDLADAAKIINEQWRTTPSIRGARTGVSTTINDLT